MVPLARADPAWRDALMVVKPETRSTWHRNLHPNRLAPKIPADGQATTHHT